MRFHSRSPKDYGVDRPDMEASQDVKSTGTNRPKQTHTTCNTQTNKKDDYVMHASTMQYLTQHLKGQHSPESLSVVNSGRETPGPIPNPEAKPARADGTATGRLWESKLPPT